MTGVFTEQADLLASLMSTIEFVTTRATVFSIFDGKQRPAKYLTRESASFLWFQLLTDVLRKMAQADMNERGIEEMLKYCELYYRDNEVELKLIENFRKNYVSDEKERSLGKSRLRFRNLPMPSSGTVNNRSSTDWSIEHYEQRTFMFSTRFAPTSPIFGTALPENMNEHVRAPTRRSPISSACIED